MGQIGRVRRVSDATLVCFASRRPGSRPPCTSRTSSLHQDCHENLLGLYQVFEGRCQLRAKLVSIFPERFCFCRGDMRGDEVVLSGRLRGDTPASGSLLVLRPELGLILCDLS